jgi:DNA-binding SARP family transcriptional activator
MSVPFQVIAARLSREHHDARKREFRGGGNPVGPGTQAAGVVEYGLLGPVQAVRDGRPLSLGGPRQRAVLVRLLLAPGRAVPAATLADDVWGGRPPRSATKTLQKYVSELRQVLGPGELRTVGGGYALDGDVDAAGFERLLAAGDAERALELWRGEALGDLPDVPFVPIPAEST